MIPRLAPRRSTTQPSQHPLAMGVENDDPMDSSYLMASASTRRGKVRKHAALASATRHAPEHGHEIASDMTLSPRPARRVVMKSSTNLDAPLSPGITQSLDFLKDPFSTLTPPVTGPRPLVVSAKRMAHNVRRQYSTKRLRRRCSTKVPNQTDGAYCLWSDAGAPPRATESSSDEEEGETLPCCPNPQGYWEYCYGSTQEITADETIQVVRARTPSWSAGRKPPPKGCLSHKKDKASTHTAIRSFLTPATTQAEEDEATPQPRKAMVAPRVQFGSPQAVEFDSEGPTVQLTPLPSEVTRQRYSMKQVEPSRGETDMSAETKRNSALLAEWEDEGPLLVTSSAARRRQQRNTRRSSSIFTPSPSSTSLLDNRDVEIVSKGDEEQESSPSTLVLENLASLCVDSPLTEQPVLASKMLTSTDSSLSSTCGQTTAASSTAELAIPLDDFNRHGAAAAMVKRMPSPDANNSAGGSALSLQAIHSVGGALGTAPVKEGRQLSPISRMAHSEPLPGGATPPNLLHCRAMISSPNAMDIVQKLLKDPAEDQTFDPKDIFLALVEDAQERRSQKGNRLAAMIQTVSPQWDGILSCLEDLKEQVRFCASTKSNTKFRLPARQEAFAKNMVVREWKELEIEFLFELSQALERNTEHAKSLWHSASSLLEGLKGIMAPISNESTPMGNVKTNATQTKEQLEKDIVKLEEEIHEQQKVARIRNAAEAPFAALHCQAASHIGVCGFRLDGYNGTFLELAYEHPIAGVESHFTYDMSHGAWSATYLSDAFISSPELLAANHPAAKFHQQVAMSCFAEENGLLQRVRNVDVSDAVLTLSLWLGGLDAATQDLVDVSNTHAIYIDWPRVNVAVDARTTLALLYDETVCRCFQPCSCVITHDQKETDLDISSKFLSLVEQAVLMSRP